MFALLICPGQDWAQCKQHIDELASGAELHGITEDKLLCFILMNNTFDKKLLDEFLKIGEAELTTEKLLQVAGAYARR